MVREKKRRKGRERNVKKRKKWEGEKRREKERNKKGIRK